jgi:hypothetical protein
VNRERLIQDFRCVSSEPTLRVAKILEACFLVLHGVPGNVLLALVCDYFRDYYHRVVKFTYGPQSWLEQLLDEPEYRTKHHSTCGSKWSDFAETKPGSYSMNCAVIAFLSGVENKDIPQIAAANFTLCADYLIEAQMQDVWAADDPAAVELWGSIEHLATLEEIDKLEQSLESRHPYTNAASLAVSIREWAAFANRATDLGIHLVPVKNAQQAETELREWTEDWLGLFMHNDKI